MAGPYTATGVTRRAEKSSVTGFQTSKFTSGDAYWFADNP